MCNRFVGWLVDWLRYRMVPHANVIFIPGQRRVISPLSAWLVGAVQISGGTQAPGCGRGNMWLLACLSPRIHRGIATVVPNEERARSRCISNGSGDAWPVHAWKSIERVSMCLSQLAGERNRLQIRRKSAEPAMCIFPPAMHQLAWFCCRAPRLESLNNKAKRPPACGSGALSDPLYVPSAP